jgi:hypothetical protein
VKNQRASNALVEFPVGLSEEFPVSIRRTEITRTVVGQGQGVSALFDLSLGKSDSDFQELTHDLFDPVRVEERGDEKFLYPVQVVTEGPGAKHFADNRCLISDFLLEQL